MRAFAIIVSAFLIVVLCAAPALANPLILWYLRDSPVGTPNGVWDDQWSGGTVFPEGEVATWEPPVYNPGCSQNEEDSAFVRLGTAEEPLLVYLDPPFTGTQVGGAATALFSFRQTSPEVSLVCMELYKVDQYGGNPVYLGMDCVEFVEIGAWPPTEHEFALATIPQMEMQSERFMVAIYSSGQYTDLIWKCEALGGWILLPQDDPNPTEAMRWTTIKAMYR